MKCISMESAIVAAKDVSHTIVCNKRFCPEWENDLIMICNDAISGFNPNKHNGSALIKYIQSKIEKDELKKDLTWRVRAQVGECCATTDYYDFEYYNYCLQLEYNQLNIEISAKINQ